MGPTWCGGASGPRMGRHRPHRDGQCSVPRGVAPVCHCPWAVAGLGQRVSRSTPSPSAWAGGALAGPSRRACRRAVRAASHRRCATRGARVRGRGRPRGRRRTGAGCGCAWPLGGPTLERRCGAPALGAEGTAGSPPPAGAAPPAGAPGGGHRAPACRAPGHPAGGRGRRGRSPGAAGRRAGEGLGHPARRGDDAAIRAPGDRPTAAPPRDAPGRGVLRDGDVGGQRRGQKRGRHAGARRHAGPTTAPTGPRGLAPPGGPVGAPRARCGLGPSRAGAGSGGAPWRPAPRRARRYRRGDGLGSAAHASSRGHHPAHSPEAGDAGGETTGRDGGDVASASGQGRAGPGPGARRGASGGSVCRPASRVCHALLEDEETASRAPRLGDACSGAARVMGRPPCRRASRDCARRRAEEKWGGQLTQRSATRARERGFSVLTVGRRSRLSQRCVQTQAGARCAEKTRQAIACAPLRPQRTPMLVYAGGSCAICATVRVVPRVLPLSPPVHAPLRTWLAQHLNQRQQRK